MISIIVSEFNLQKTRSDMTWSDIYCNKRSYKNCTIERVIVEINKQITYNYNIK